MRIKSGSSGCDIRFITPPLVIAWMIDWVLWQERHPELSFVMTSNGEGNHGVGSKHFTADAYDRRLRLMSGETLVWGLDAEERESYRKQLWLRLGEGAEFDVTISPKHKNLHVELDVKRRLR
jgi:hypothetical protein